ncbi:MAG: hypothetical protein M3O85_06275 [Acidobacteriota bacterium]|nr:hypothetical protein [Acidobacteriota bacterium]
MAVAYSVLLIGVFFFKREALFSPPFVVAILILAFASALGMLVKAKGVGKYRKAFLFKGIGMLLAIGGVVSFWLGASNSVGSCFTLSGVASLAVGSHFALSAAREEARSHMSGQSEKSPATP